MAANRLQYSLYCNSAATDLITRCNLVACNHQHHCEYGTLSDTVEELQCLTFIQRIYHKRTRKKRNKRSVWFRHCPWSICIARLGEDPLALKPCKILSGWTRIIVIVLHSWCSQLVKYNYTLVRIG